MRPTNKEYDNMAKKQSPASPKVKDFVCAFVIGGLICVLGQLLMEWYSALGLEEKVVKMAVPSTLIFIYRICFMKYLRLKVQRNGKNFGL